MNYQTPSGCVYGLENARYLWTATTQVPFRPIECYGVTDQLLMYQEFLRLGVISCAILLLCWSVYKLV